MALRVYVLADDGGGGGLRNPRGQAYCKVFEGYEGLRLTVWPPLLLDGVARQYCAVAKDTIGATQPGGCPDEQTNLSE